jgi:hypothetical protein
MSLHQQDPYRAAVALVLTAPDTEAAFDDYAALIKAYRANEAFRIDGKRRDETEWRREMDVNPFEVDGYYLSLALTLAEHEGLTLAQVADLFGDVPPDSGEQALCIVEDALCILDRVPKPADYADGFSPIGEIAARIVARFSGGRNG